MKKVLINGAGGFIGANLVEHFINAGYSVRESDIAGANLERAKSLGAEIAYAALNDPEAIDASMKGIDVVIHSAAIFNLAVPRDEIIATNVNGTRYYCEAALKHGVERFVLFSTVGVYGIPRCTNITEDDTKSPRNPYEESKWLSEQVGMKYHYERGLPLTALRPTLVYGPGSRYGQAMYVTLFSALKCWGFDNLPIPAGGKVNHHVHVLDVCSAVQTLAEASNLVHGQAFNVADEHPLTSASAMECFCELSGIKAELKPQALQFAMAPTLKHGQGLLKKHLLGTLNKRLEKTWPRLVERFNLEPAFQPTFDVGWLDYLWADHSYSTEKLKSLGWNAQVPTFTEGLPETVEWYRAQRWLPSIEEMQTFATETKQRNARQKLAS